MSCELALIQELSGLFGPTGCEDEVADRIEALLGGRCESFCRDRMGNVIALLRTGDVDAPNRAKVMISAHMDEVGVMITEICEDGLLRFDTVGGIHVSVLEGRKMILGDEINRVRGVVASKAIHHKKTGGKEQAHSHESAVYRYRCRQSGGSGEGFVRGLLRYL